MLAISLAGAKASARGQWLIIGGLFLLMLIISALLAQPALDRLYDLDSADEDGLLALSLWLDELGYEVGDIGPTAYQLTGADGNPADLLFVYPNSESYSEAQADQLADWVDAGGTLVLIGPTDDDFVLIERFGVTSAPQVNIVFSQEEANQPLLPHPPEGWTASLNSVELDLTDAPNAVPILSQTASGLNAISARDRRATVAIQPLGSGLIWHLSPSHDLTNQALDLGKDGHLLPALLRSVPDGGTILFDTYHLYGSAAGAADGAPRSLRGWLYQTNPGRAIILSALVLFGYLLLQGIRLGPPLPLREEMVRREAAEYVVAMAGLQRRLGDPSHVAEAQRRRLKQALGSPLAIPSTLSDQVFIEQWQERNSGLDSETVDNVTEILNRLSEKPTEQTLVEMAARIDKMAG